MEKKATDLVVLQVDQLTTLADYFIVCSGNSERQVKAIAEAIDGEISRHFSSRPIIEGGAVGTWILLDYGDIIVHVFREDIREYYGIENMWRDAEQVPTSVIEMSSLPVLPARRSHSTKVAHL